LLLLRLTNAFDGRNIRRIWDTGDVRRYARVLTAGFRPFGRL
jgi:hypothetical protein